MERKPSTSPENKPNEETKPVSAQEMRTQRLLPDVMAIIHHETRPIEQLMGQKRKIIKAIVESAMNGKLFPPKIDVMWKSLLKRSMGREILPEDFLDDLMKKDALSLVKRFMGIFTSTDERRHFVWQVHYALASNKKRASDKKYRVYFFYLWFDKIKQQDIVRQIEKMNDEIFALHQQTREISERIEAEHGFIHMRPPGPVTVLKGVGRIKDSLQISFELAMLNLKQKPWIDEESILILDNFLNFKSDTMLHLLIDTTYDKKAILDQVDELIFAIQHLQGRKRGAGTRKSIVKEELDMLVEKMFLRLYVEETKTEETSINEICEYLESIGNPIEAESVVRRYLRSIKKRYGVKNVKELRSVKEMEKPSRIVKDPDR